MKVYTNLDPRASQIRKKVDSLENLREPPTFNFQTRIFFVIYLPRATREFICRSS